MCQMTAQILRVCAFTRAREKSAVYQVDKKKIWKYEFSSIY